jgi:hypothetical protein
LQAAILTAKRRASLAPIAVTADKMGNPLFLFQAFVPTQGVSVLKIAVQSMTIKILP